MGETGTVPVGSDVATGTLTMPTASRDTTFRDMSEPEEDAGRQVPETTGKELETVHQFGHKCDDLLMYDPDDADQWIQSDTTMSFTDYEQAEDNQEITYE